MHERLIQLAKHYIDALLSDTTVPPSRRLTSLKYIREHLDELIKTLELDIGDEGRALDETFDGLQP